MLPILFANIVACHITLHIPPLAVNIFVIQILINRAGDKLRKEQTPSTASGPPPSEMEAYSSRLRRD